MGLPALSFPTRPASFSVSCGWNLRPPWLTCTRQHIPSDGMYTFFVEFILRSGVELTQHWHPDEDISWNNEFTGWISETLGVNKSRDK